MANPWTCHISCRRWPLEGLIVGFGSVRFRCKAIETLASSAVLCYALRMPSEHQETTAQSRQSDRHYDHAGIESKWQKRWTDHKTWEAKIDATRPKYYLLDMFPYPSGRLHMGHVRNYTLGDVIARWRRSEGRNVMHPMGWDAFGLPAENAAIKNKLHPEKWTLENIQNMKKQLERLGLGYDWSREVTTCLPDYYKWEQLIFTQMFERGLAYKKASTVNWCPSCATVLANEQVQDGKCWRCESVTTTRELEQWFLKTTQYVEELLQGLDTLEGWPERVKSMQRHWIGKSEGAEIEFSLERGGSVRIFTTRPDTLFGVTYMAVAPEHPLAVTLSREKPQQAEVDAFIEKCRKQDKIARTAEDAPKEGVFTGAFAIHPLTEAKVPVYVANFVLMEYGTGALMAVPAHDQRDHSFARKYGVEIREVITPNEGNSAPPVTEAAFVDAGVLIHSGRFDGMDSEKAKSAITSELEKQGKGRKGVNYKLRDWGLSRQRYWGAPIPIIYCGSCGAVPVPAQQLPVVLPKDVSFSGEGGSPLAKHPDFTQTACPKCGAKDARRETDTMDTFMESSWYYLRYLSAQESSRPFNPEDAAYWLGVDQYIGGIEHATMHLLYFRFYHKVLRDLGYFPASIAEQDRNEPVRNLMNQGIVYKDGAKMSKSKGNVVEPDGIIAQYGADTARLFSMFAAPPEKVLEWAEQGVEGSSRFLNRVWRLVENHEAVIKGIKPFAGKHSDLVLESSKKLRSKTHQTIAKVIQDFTHGYRFNTAIAAIMELVNEIYVFPLDLGLPESRAVLREAIESVLRLMNPFAPHVAEELWERMGQPDWLVNLPHLKADEEALIKETITYVVQVNGKLRGNIQVPAAETQEGVVELAKDDHKVAPHLEGKTVARTIFVQGKLVNFVVK